MEIGDKVKVSFLEGEYSIVDIYPEEYLFDYRVDTGTNIIPVMKNQVTKANSLNNNLQEAVENHNKMVEQQDSATDKQVGGSWYKKFDIQPIEFIMQNEDALHPTDAFMLNNVLKYTLRHRDKNGEEDLKKAIHYIELVIEHEYK